MLRHQNRLTIPPEAFRIAAETTTWPARMQRLGEGPLTDLLPQGSALWLDGGHNPAAGAAVSAALRGVADGQPVHLILGMLSNKDPAGLLAPFSGLATTLHAVPVSNHEHHDPQALATIARSLGMDTAVAPDVRAALQAITNATDDTPTIVLILGSLYLAGEVLSANDEPPD